MPKLRGCSFAPVRFLASALPADKFAHPRDGRMVRARRSRKSKPTAEARHIGGRLAKRRQYPESRIVAQEGEKLRQFPRMSITPGWDHGLHVGRRNLDDAGALSDEGAA